MKKFNQILALLLCLLVCLTAMPVFAEDAADDPAAEEMVPMEGVEVEGVTEGDGEGDTAEFSSASSESDPASIEGLKPLYTTKIKPFTADGTSIRMRAGQSSETDVVTVIKKDSIITVYAVYPSYVLAEYNGHVGYIIRTWVDENMTPIDPTTTPPYGTTFTQYVATTTQDCPVYNIPSTDGEIGDIVIGEGSRIAVLEFVDGFAKILYWRNYGYVDANLLTDLIVVSSTDEPNSPETPIAAFASYFEHHTGKEGNAGRCMNIVRSCELMSRVIQPGEVLNFNSHIGPYKKSNGYHPAPVLIDRGTQLGYGGGTCQSSSTLYNTIRQLSGITVLFRRPHGPGCAKYLPMHQDAAVGSADLNLIFRNDYDFPIRIDAHSTGEGALCIMIFRGE